MADDGVLVFGANTLVPPGSTLFEYLEFNGWSQRDLARRTGLTPKTISEICNGKAPISPLTALALEKVFQRPAHFWLNLQARYDEAKARQTNVASLTQWSKWAEKFPLKEMKRLGWIEGKGYAESTTDELLEFFGVSSPDSWQSVWANSDVAYRQTRQFKTTAESISAWIRATEIQASQIETAEFDEAKLLSMLGELRSQTREPADRFIPAVQALCASAGVAVVWVPELKQTGISGCARWLTDRRALIALTLRYKTDDQLWFTFFHEIAHLILHRKKFSFILDNAHDDLIDNVIDPKMQKNEEEANRFSADTLIPPDALSQFILQRKFTNEAIHDFSNELTVGPGIVVGRLQREGLIAYHQGNKLKRTFSWELDSGP